MVLRRVGKRHRVTHEILDSLWALHLDEWVAGPSGGASCAPTGVTGSAMTPPSHQLGVPLVASKPDRLVGAVLRPEWMRQIRLMCCFARRETAQRPDVTRGS
jgi:hypothetical protein